MDDLRQASSTLQDEEEGIPSHASIRERLAHFTWAWFEMTMSTGAIAIVLGNQQKLSYQFYGLRTIGKVFFIIDLVLFLLFCACMTIRFLVSPSALKRSLHHPHESFFFGTFWVSIALILYCTQLYGVPSCGPWLVKALEVCFWIYAGMALLVVVFQYHVIFDKNSLPVADTLPSWIFPAYPFLVLGPLAGVLLYDQHGSSGVNILIGGILFQGLGFSLAFLMYSLYFTRLVGRELPIEPKRPAMYVAVGPAAYTANAFIALAYQAPSTLPANFLGMTVAPCGELWKAFGVPCGIFLWLLGFWFFAVATVSVVLSAKKMHYTLNYWGFIFPNAGLTTATIQIGYVLDSNGIKAVATAMVICLVAGYIAVALATLKAVWKGEVLWPGRDEDEEDIEGHGMDEGKQEKAA